MTLWTKDEIELRQTMMKLAIESDPGQLETYTVVVSDMGDVIFEPGPFQWTERLL